MSSVNLTKLGANLLKNATSGEMVEVGSFWREQTVVLFFLRRFGCQVCRWMAAEVSKLEKDLQANGVALVGVGPEEMGVKEFKDGGFLKGEIYIDEKKQCYKDLGFKRYNAINIVPAAMGKKVREIASKASAEGIQGNFSGDLLQSGGMLIVAKGGEKVLMHFVQNTPGDNASLEDIAKALGISVSVQAGERPQIFTFDATSRLLVLDRVGMQSVTKMFAQDRRFSDLEVMTEELNIMMDEDLLLKINAFF